MLAFVWGTRPESVKIAPIAAELRALGVPFVSLCTGQHTTLLQGSPAEVDLPDTISLAMPSTDGKVGSWVAKAVPKLLGAFTVHGITRVVVQGDTMSALAGSHAARIAGLPVAHVEAGLRSHHLEEPWPEEAIRVAIAREASLHLAPTERAGLNLLAEGVDPQTIYVTGNSGISALHRYGSHDASFSSAPLVLTMHRREWVDAPVRVADVFRAVLEGAETHPGVDFVWPMHPNVRKHWETFGAGDRCNLHVADPMPYRDMTHLVRNATGLITDSGGLQEEAAALGVKTCVLRNVSDRPESIDLGLAKLFPPTGDGMRSAIQAITDPTWVVRPLSCYGTPESAGRIARIVAEWTP